MSKRMISTSDKAEIIIQRYKEHGLCLSEEISKAIVDYELPQFNPLRLDAMFLLDTVANGLENWRVPCGTRMYPQSEEDASLEAIKRGLSWLKNHHIKDPAPIELILSHFKGDGLTDELSREDIPDVLLKDLDYVQMKLTDNNSAFEIGLTILGRDMIDRWDILWDDNETYEALLTIISYQCVQYPFDCFETISIMRFLEQTFLYERSKR